MMRIPDILTGMVQVIKRKNWPKYCILDGSRLSFTHWERNGRYSSKTGKVIIFRYLQCPAATTIETDFHNALKYDQFMEYKNAD